ncbi:U6 small nuclear RNA adenine-43-N6-methyltransferase, partial [Hondaea fermentalgiana]
RDDAAEAVARGLLEADFGIAWSASKDSVFLTPAVPRSVNYLEWVQDLLCAAAAATPSPATERETIIDVGTGASCILPLIGCGSAKANRGRAWRFIGTEIDPRAVQHAEHLVRANGLGHRITVTKVSPGTYLAGALTPALDTVPGPVASVCNPPFFATYRTVAQTSGAKQARLVSQTAPAEADFRGTENEKSFALGGELPFFKAMVQEMVQSEKVRARMTWATCMFGHKASIEGAIDFLEQQLDMPVAVAATWLVQGRKLRWALAWSFNPALVRLKARSSLPNAKETATSDADCALFFTLAAARDRIERSPHKQHPSLEFESPVDLLETQTRLDDFWGAHSWQVQKHCLENNTSGYRARIVICQDNALCLCIAVLISAQRNVRLAVLLAPHGDEAASHNLMQRIRTDVIRQSRFWKRRARKQGQDDPHQE